MTEGVKRTLLTILRIALIILAIFLLQDYGNILFLS